MAYQAPWEVAYGPYWRQELRRREVQRRALGHQPTSPAVRMAEEYGAAQARLQHERAVKQQQFANYNVSKRTELMEKAQKNQQTSQAITGIGTLAMGGYKLGKEVGLWGGPKATPGVTTAMGTTRGPMEEGLTQAGEFAKEAIQGGGYEYPGTAFGPKGETAISGLGPRGESALGVARQPGMALTDMETTGMTGIPNWELEPMTFPAANAAEAPAISTGFEGTVTSLAPIDVVSSAALPAMGAPALSTSTALGTEAAISGIELGATAAATAATGAAETGFLASMAPAMAILGPVGWGLGIASIVGSMLFGDKLKGIFG